MTIRNIISLVESVAPTVESIEENIAHRADEAAVASSVRPAQDSLNIQYFDRVGNVRPGHMARDADTIVADGWAAIIYVDDWRVRVKINGNLVTRQALDSLIRAIETTKAGDIHIEDKTSRIPARHSGWTRDGGLKALRGLLLKIKVIRSVSGDPKAGSPDTAFDAPPTFVRGSVVAENLDEAYLLELMEMADEDDYWSRQKAKYDAAVEAKDLKTAKEIGERLFSKGRLANLDENLGMDWQSCFRREMDKQPKTEVGFERACDVARLTKEQREMARQDTLANLRSTPLSEPLSETHCSGGVPMSALRNMKRWDAEHALAVKDEVESRGGSITNADDTTAASDDLAFADRALPIAQHKNPIRGIKENSLGMFVLEDESDDGEADSKATKYFWPQDQAAHDYDRDKADEKVEEGIMGRLLANGPRNEKVINMLALAEDERHASRLGRSRPLTNPQVEFGDGEFYSPKQISLVNQVLNILKKRHEKTSRTPRADVMADFKELSRRAGYMGPQPMMGSDGIMNENWFGDGDAGAWKRHTGRSCPVPGETFVHYKTRGGRKGSGTADGLDWGHDSGNPADDIVAYSL